jgi:hypothetical protein
MVNAFFDRTAPLYITTEGGFDAYPCEVDEEVVEFVEKIAAMKAYMDAEIDRLGAPEDTAQQLADLLSHLVTSK